ncbi:MAG TPA: choice-of-anchor Q domain-containing protein [Gemmataceae bacterium]
MALSKLRRWLSGSFRPAGLPDRYRRAPRLRLDQLEERAVPATFVVSNTADSGAGSLRAALTQANATPGADVIDATGVTGTISLLTVLPNVGDDTTINGPGAANLTVTRNSGAASFRIFTIQRAGAHQISVTLNGLTVSNGIGTSDVDGSGGGGISTAAEHVVLNGLVITGNRSTGPGGGIDTRADSDLTVINTTISGNSSGANGGGMYAGDSGQFTLINSTVSGNQCAGSGAGLYFWGQAPTKPVNWVLKNSTISGNMPGGGITMYGPGNALTIQNCTITGNQSTQAGGIFATDANDTITLQSTIVSGNTSGGFFQDINTPGTLIATNSAIGDSGGFNLDPSSSGNLPFGAALNLGPLQNNGGPTQTHLPGAGSPLINAGFNAVVQGIDQRGFQRTAGSQVDIGAVESESLLPAANIPPTDAASSVTAAGFQVQVVYTDDTAINAATIDTNDLTFTRPDGTPVTATISSVSVSPAGNGTPRTATYTVNPPGGSWDGADNGTYYVRSVAGQVTDTSGNAVPAGIIGQFVLTVVTNTSDSGPGSLRQAILDSNASVGFKNVIAFVGTGAATISPASPLPTITDPVLIDGTTQAGFAGAPLVELAGNLAPAGSTGLEISAARTTVRGLVLNRWGTALVAGANDVIQGNYIGTNAAGTAASANGIGVFIVSANGALIGSDLDGTNDAAERNVISGNTTAGVRGGGASSLLTFAQWTTGPGANNHYYLRSSVSATWVQAEQFAVAFGGHLASIGSADENAFVAGTMGAGWIGFTDDPAYGGQEFGDTSGSPNRGEGWVWTDGTPAPYPVGGPLVGYMNWNAGEPNNSGGAENYAEIQGSGGWNDLSTQTNPGIAEFTTLPNIPAILAALGGTSPNRIQGNYIGTNAAGTAAVPNGTGLDLGGALGDVVRGNVISGNTGAGLTVSSTAVVGPNGHYYVQSPSATTWTAAEQFAVSNGGHLVSIGSAAENAIVLGVGTGWIGFTDDPAYGGQEFGNTSGSPNRGEGWVWTDGTPAPYPVGGPLVGYMNWNGGEPNNAGAENYAEITGGGGWNDLNATSTDRGIIELLSAPSAALLGAGLRTAGGLTITGNIIGRNAANSAALANGGAGISVANNALVTIGGTGAGDGNTISGNTGAGIAVTGNNANASIRGNSIFANGGLGIDLGTAGVTANDTLDGDTGPNGLQNFPLLTAVTGGATTTVSGSINSTANTVLTLDFYASGGADPSGNGEGQRFLGSTTVTTDGFGNATFSNVVLAAASAGGEVISATATDPSGNTSEFAANATVPGGSAAPTVVSTVVDAGTAQRSSVRSITVTFSSAVNFTGGNDNAAAAFQLARTGPTGATGNVGLTATVSTDGSGRTVVKLTFSGAFTESNTAAGVDRSLIDGKYTLTINSAAVTGAGGVALDGDANGTPGGDYTLATHRLFGDIDGDGDVDLLDLNPLVPALFATQGQPNYNQGFDFEGDGDVDLLDLNQFVQRLFLSGYTP